ncbi:MAG: CHC2 zinc finger domain-containing protein, partial [Xanthobacteraceae bacterium]
MTEPRRHFTDAELDALKARNPVDAVAGAWVKLRRKRARGGKGFTHVGPCPLCSRNPQAKDDSRFECGPDHWVCAGCGEGGSVFHLLMKRDGIEFVTAVERLGGTRPEATTPEIAKRRGRADHAAGGGRIDIPEDLREPDALRRGWIEGWNKAASAAAAELRYRDRERARLRKWWDEAARIHDGAGHLDPRNPVVVYFAARGSAVPANAGLRFHPDIPLFADGREDEPLLVHRGPAKLAAIFGPDGKFSGLHITWLDPALCGPSRVVRDGSLKNKGKARVFHPDTGEELPSKKSRGSKQGGYIDLGGACCPPSDSCSGDPSRTMLDDGSPIATAMVAGEGNETVAAVYTRLVRAGHDLSRTLFRGAIDLGNLGGRA